MTHTTLTVTPSQSLETGTRAQHKKSPDLATLQGLVGGCIETVPHLTSMEIDGVRVRCTVYINEEGRLEGLAKNLVMSNLWRRELLRQNPRAEFSYEPELFGPVVVVFKEKSR